MMSHVNANGGFQPATESLLQLHHQYAVYIRTFWHNKIRFRSGLCPRPHCRDYNATQWNF